MSAVTVLMPIKNGGEFLLNAIRNIEAMLGQSDEVIVIDDNSTDETPLMLKKWVALNPQVRVITNTGSGLVDALNLGLREATSEWIARVDVDDQYDPRRLSVQRELIKSDVVAIFCDYELFYDGVRSLGTIHSAVFSPAVSTSLISGQRTAHPSVLFNKSAATSAGGYLKQDFPAEDLSLWLRMSRLGKLVSSPEVLLHYRVGKSSVSGIRRNEMKMMKEVHLRQIGINPIDIKAFGEKYFELFEMYEGVKDATARQILLFRDFRDLQLHSGDMINNKLIDKHFKQWLLKTPSASLQLAFMVKDKLTRGIYRSTRFPKS
jgi:glycosyltransferase involved in cell wall biosynthesis